MYQDNNPNLQGTNNNQTNQPTPQQNLSDTQYRSEYRWQGDYYSYHPQTSAQTSAYSSSPAGGKPPEKQKKTRKAGKIIASIAAVIVCCAIVSGGTLAAFIGLINSGTIALQNTGTETNPAYTITKLIDNSNSDSGASNTTSGTVSELSTQEIAAKILPSIVCIQNYQISDTLQNGMFGSYDNGSQEGGASSDDTGDVSPAGEGSGIIASSDGYIITNHHVIEDATSIKVITYDGKTYEAELIGSDSVTDLAVIKIDAEGLQAAEFGSSSDLQIGDTVVAAGNPGGMEFSFSTTVGYVSALNRSVTNSSTGYTMECIQTDAAVNPGNSGGALVNVYGQVVGIVSSKIVSEAYEGLSFAIPIDDAQSVISDLQAYGYVKDRAVLGITGGYIDSMTARFYGISSGWYVESVTNTSVSDAGIRQGDVITEIDGTAVTSSNTLSAAIAAKKPGDTVTLTISRALTGDTFSVDVTLMESTGQ